ncbi:Glycine--tRNA ligase, chloroplastic/mitochondrial 2 [Trifolium repens]|nr:Glycine--tRNA ligase, chloroplastic/mitochondrial 2 [Trifolium repens]
MFRYFGNYIHSFCYDYLFSGLDIDDFVEIPSQLIQPLEDFFNNVFVMMDDAKIRNNRLALLKAIAELPKGIADLALLPGF